jgi:hypothetical protein
MWERSKVLGVDVNGEQLPESRATTSTAGFQPSSGLALALLAARSCLSYYTV